MKESKKIIGVFADNYDRLAKVAIRVLGDKETALDALQDVALILLRKGYRQDEIHYPIAFLTTCVKNAALTYIRKASKTVLCDPAVMGEMNDDPYSSTSLDYIEWVETLNRYLSTYSPEYREAFIKHYIEGYPLKILGEELGMTPNALSQQFKRMRDKIADQSPTFLLLIMFLPLFTGQ